MQLYDIYRSQILNAKYNSDSSSSYEYIVWWEKHVCEQLVHSRHMKVKWPEFEPAISLVWLYNM